MNSWVKLHRKFEEWQWYQDNNTKSVFIHLLIKANYQDNMWMDKVIESGQLVTSVNKLSSELSLSASQIRTSLKKLTDSQEINITSTNKYSKITLKNWDNYQVEYPQILDRRDVKKTTNKTQSNNNQASPLIASSEDIQNEVLAENDETYDKQTTTIKESKKKEVLKEKKLLKKEKATSLTLVEYSRDFEKLWKLTKVGVKSSSYKAYNSRVSEKYSIEEMAYAWTKYYKTVKDKKFLMHLSTFLSKASGIPRFLEFIDIPKGSIPDVFSTQNEVVTVFKSLIPKLPNAIKTCQRTLLTGEYRRIAFTIYQKSPNQFPKQFNDFSDAYLTSVETLTKLSDVHLVINSQYRTSDLQILEVS